jgi:hypothetical protein
MEQSEEIPTLLQMAQSVGHPRGFYRFKAAPRAYEIDGKQYVGVMSGKPSGFWADKNPSAPTVFIFALP